MIRVEQRRDGSVAARFRDRYLSVTECVPQPKVASAKPAKTKPRDKSAKPSEWNNNFDLKKGPKIWQAMGGSGRKPKE